MKPVAPKVLKILILEDLPSDAALMERVLRKAEMPFISQRVDTKEGFIRALEDFTPDVVLLDYALPEYNGAEALAHVRHAHPEVPAIMVTGSLGDEAVMELLHAGATDYVLKNNLMRLPPAVVRAISIEEAARARNMCERRIREHEAEFRSLVEQNVAGIAIVRADATIAYANPYLWRLLGYKRAELVGRAIPEVVPEAERPAVTHNLAILRSEKRHFLQFETQLQAKDGRRIEILVNGSPSIYGGQPVIIAVLLDISERKRAEQVLRVSEERFRLLFENAPDAILVYDPERHRFVDANAQAEQLFGCKRGEIIRHGPDYFYSPDQPDHRPVSQSLAENDRRALAGERLIYERRIRRPTGEKRICQVTLVKFPSATGQLLRGSFIDITARKEDEQKLQRTLWALRTLTRANEVIIKAAGEAELLNEMCRVIIEADGYRIAAIGMVGSDAAKSVRFVASAGEGAALLVPRLEISWADVPSGWGTTGRAIRTGQTQISQDLVADQTMAPWAELGIEYRIASVVTLPLKDSLGVFGVLLIYAAEIDAFDTEELKLLQELADGLAYGLCSLRVRSQTTVLEQRWRASLQATVGSIANTVEMRDPYTTGHQQRVARLAVAMAGLMGMSDHDIEGIRLAAMVHDVGKINLPAEILNKPGELTATEYALLKEHAEVGYRIIRDVDFPWPIAEMVRQHHERLDGSGYPRGLKGSAILAGAKIIAVADVVEAMMSHRPYRPALGIEAALAQIEQNKGRLFDPAAVSACVALFRDMGFDFDAADCTSAVSAPGTADSAYGSIAMQAQDDDCIAQVCADRESEASG